MTRQPIDGGGWFDREEATCYEEDRRFDGSNMISVATGSQFDHEQLYVTRRGTYVRYRWSQWQGSGERWTRLSVAEAAAWLTTNGYEADEPALATAQAAEEV